MTPNYSITIARPVMLAGMSSSRRRAGEAGYERCLLPAPPPLQSISSGVMGLAGEPPEETDRGCTTGRGDVPGGADDDDDADACLPGGLPPGKALE